MTTNIAESMNNAIMRARSLPITSAHEFLRHMLQKWFSDRRAKAATINSSLTTAAQVYVDAQYQLSTQCVVVPIVALTKYLVRHPEKGDGIVDLPGRTCNCGRWDLEQLPCYHAIAAAK